MNIEYDTLAVITTLFGGLLAIYHGGHQEVCHLEVCLRVRFMLPGGRPAAAKKDWMNTHMTFDSLEPRRSLLKVGHQEYLTLKSSGNSPPD